jgi:poly(ADP-ribose) glycohydrolase ARH3
MPEGRHLTAAQIESQFGPNGLRDFVSGYHLGLLGEPRQGYYTDDGNSLLALASSLVACKGLDPAHAALSYAAFWACHEPERGYPDTAKAALAAVAAGGDIMATGRLIFAEGSYGNGAAMRIAPVGFVFRHAENEVLRAAVRAAVVSSHVHPEAVDAAFVLAKAIALLTQETPRSFTPNTFLSTLEELAETRVMKSKLSILHRHLGGPMWSAVVWALPEADEQGRLDPEIGEEHRLKHRPCFQIRGTTAVASALWAFLDNVRDPEEIVVRAVGLGGDADTIGSMAGALAGALHGEAWVPERWMTGLENGVWGRDYALRTASEMAELDCTQSPISPDTWRSMDSDVGLPQVLQAKIKSDARVGETLGTRENIRLLLEKERPILLESHRR